MTFLTRISLANRLIVGLITLAIIVFGVLAIFGLKQELLPNISAPTAVVSASYPGATPQIVAKEVSTPIEQAVKGVSGVTKVESSSTNGLASITVQWDYGLDTDKVVADIRNAIDSVSATIPSTVTTDVVTGSTDDIPVLQLAVASDASLASSGQLVDDVAVPQLAGIDGVRQVTLTGQNTTQLRVTLRPAALRSHDLTAAAVTEAVRAQALVTPAGTAYDGNTELAVQVGTALDSVAKFQALPIASTDGPVALSALADVKVVAVEATSVARSDGRPALSITVLKDSDADAVDISHAVKDMTPGLQQKLGHNTTFTTVFDQAPMIEDSIHDLAVEGGLGLVFAVLVILLFLFSVRSTIITAISIPMSLLIAMIALQLGHYSLNIFTLAALTVAIGRVVDDSIVVIENIKRHAAGRPTLTPGDIISSVKEVAGAVTASTLTTVAVFLPVAVVSGVVGELFRPFAVTVAVALVASLVVSMSVVPVLAYWFLRRRPSPAAEPAARAAADVSGEESRITRLQRGYLPVLRFGLRRPILTLLLALVVFAGTLGSATFLKTDFLGSVTDQSSLTITQELPAGTRLAATSAAATRVEKVLASTPQVSGYLTTIGGAGGVSAFTGVSEANTATYTVTLPEGTKSDDVRPLLQQKLSALQGLGTFTVAAANSGATNNDVTVTVTGDNADALRPGAQRVQQLLATVPGLTDIRSNLADQRKVLEVDVDLKRAAAQGFTQSDVGQAVSSALTGTKVGTVTLSGESRDILVRVQSTGTAPADIANLELPVSQLQSQKAQDAASDRLTAKQKKATQKAQREADDATKDSQKELRKQRSKARDSLSDVRKQLKKLKASAPKAPVAPPAGTPPLPVSQTQLAQQQYAEQLQKYAEQVAQLSATVTSTEKSIDQLDDQLDSTKEQADKTADQRKQSNALTNEQEDLADVRATPIRVKDVATVKSVLAPTTVTQIDGVRSVTLTATPPSGNLGSTTSAIQQKLDTADLPAGVTAQIGGSSQDQQQAFKQLGLAMLAAILLVFIIMVATFRSLLQPLVLLISIPFAATGAIAALLITHTPLGVPSMIGLLMLIGIVVTNAIVLIDLINQYRGRGEDLLSAVVDGARLRLRPIIMTASATIFALIPMGLGLTGGGAFISRPLAVVVIGGLVSSTVLTLLLVPVLYTLVERRGERRRLAAGQGQGGSGPNDEEAVAATA